MKTRLLIIIAVITISYCLPLTFAQYMGDVNSSERIYEERLGTAVSNRAQEKILSENESVNYVDFRDAKGEIIEKPCIVGLRASPDETFSDQISYTLKCNPFMIYLPFVMLSIVILTIFVIWRKRK